MEEKDLKGDFIMSEIMRSIDPNAQLAGKFAAELRTGLVGLDDQASQITDVILANRHVLLEGIPGTGKTRIATNLSDMYYPGLDQEEFHNFVGRFQGTRDKLPADVLGAEVYDPRTGLFSVRRGPIFANILFADEMNRNETRTQAAINEAAQERQVTIGNQTLALPNPFNIIATQNAHELGQGTSRMSDALTDRFGGSIYFGNPTSENKRIVGMNDEIEPSLMTAQEKANRLNRAKPVLTPTMMIELMRAVADTKIEDKAVKRAIEAEERLVDMNGVTLVSGDETTAMGYRFVKDAVRIAKANALRDGKASATVENMDRVLPLVLAHRITGIESDSHITHPAKLEIVADAMKNSRVV
jgi:MoxR-like ATPase